MPISLPGSQRAHQVSLHQVLKARVSPEREQGHTHTHNFLLQRQPPPNDGGKKLQCVRFTALGWITISGQHLGLQPGALW